MITYFLNWMGPVSLRWYEENNVPYVTVYKTFENLNKKLEKPIEPKWVKDYTESYSCGRIDIQGVEGEPFGLEYSVGVMKSESWGKLSEWLRELKTEHLLGKEELFARFEKECNHRIEWFSRD